MWNLDSYVMLVCLPCERFQKSGKYLSILICQPPDDLGKI